jgi:hypothetical protein
VLLYLSRPIFISVSYSTILTYDFIKYVPLYLNQSPEGSACSVLKNTAIDL